MLRESYETHTQALCVKCIVTVEEDGTFSYHLVLNGYVDMKVGKLNLLKDRPTS